MTYATAITALNEPNRRSIVEVLSTGSCSVTDLANQMPISRPAVSQHLKVLLHAGLVTVRTSGTRRNYSLDPAGTADLRAYLDRVWGDALASFAQHIDQRNANV